MNIIRLRRELLFPLQVRPASTFNEIKLKQPKQEKYKLIAIDQLTSGQQGKLVYAVQKLILNVWHSLSVFGTFSQDLNFSLRS
jgi:hypothetical protein